MLEGKTSIVTGSSSGIRNFRLGALAAAAMATVLFALPVRAADPSKLIETVTTEIIEIAKAKTGADRRAAMRQVVQANFDLPYMGRSALGTHWNQASDQQRTRFLAAVEASEARAYSERLARHAGYSVTIRKVMARPNGGWVRGRRLRPTGVAFAQKSAE